MSLNIKKHIRFFLEITSINRVVYGLELKMANKGFKDTRNEQKNALEAYKNLHNQFDLT